MTANDDQNLHRNQVPKAQLSFPGHSDFPFAHPFDPLIAQRAGLKRIRKVLCFPCNLVAAELHDAHGVGRLPVIRQNVLGDSKITAANDSPHSETLFARLIGARDLYVAPTADSLARLWVFQHRILEIDVVLRLKIVGIGCNPMPIQCRTYLLSSHMTLQRHQTSIPLLTQDTFTEVTLPDHVDIVIHNDRWRLDLAARESKHTDPGERLARSPPKLSSTVVELRST